MLNSDLVLPVDTTVVNLWVIVVLVFLDNHGKPDCLRLVLASVGLCLVCNLFTDFCEVVMLCVGERSRDESLDCCVTRCIGDSTSLGRLDDCAVFRKWLAGSDSCVDLGFIRL